MSKIGIIGLQAVLGGCFFIDKLDKVEGIGGCLTSQQISGSIWVQHLFPVYVRDKGIVIHEPSVVAIERDTGKVLAVGEDARQMIGRTPGHIVAIRPLKDGVIADYEVTETMLRYFVNKACGSQRIQTRVVICVPSGVTSVEKRAVMEATM